MSSGQNVEKIILDCGWKLCLGPVYTDHQLQCCDHCDDATDSVLIEKDGVTRKWIVISFWNDSIVLNKNSITSVIAMSSQLLKPMVSVN